MNLADVAISFRRRMDEMQADIFKNPPQNYEDFIKRLGIWKGLGDGLSIIQDARKDNDDD
jgi:hypothetical protein